MNVYEAMKRRSIRNYSEREVEDKKLEKILEAGRVAPSGKNAQGWKFIVTQKQKIKDKLVDDCKGQKFIAEGDYIITVCVNEEEVYQKHGSYMTSFPMDGAIALQQMILAATAEGLGTCWIGAFKEKEVKETLNIPESYRVVGLTPLGYPAEKGRDRGRKPLEEIVFQEKWSK